MDFKIVFSPSARKDLQEIVEYIAAEDQRTAERIGMALIQATKSLTEFPRKGRVVPEFEINSLREILLSPYRIVYRTFDESGNIEIVRIWHAARGTPEV
jgi:toxin ParE1/3/4